MDSLEAFLQPESIILDFVRVQNYLNRLYVVAPQKVKEAKKKEKLEKEDNHLSNTIPKAWTANHRGKR